MAIRISVPGQKCRSGDMGNSGLAHRAGYWQIMRIAAAAKRSTGKSTTRGKSWMKLRSMILPNAHDPALSSVYTITVALKILSG